jgi:hypothetical protein
MRTIKELLTLVSQQEELFNKRNCPGLCALIYSLSYYDFITHDEVSAIISYIEDNRPIWYSRYFDIRQKYSLFYWNPFEWEPRYKWLLSRIKKEKYYERKFQSNERS